jgi:hypothetical protein
MLWRPVHSMRGACCPRRGRTSDTRARRGAQLSLPIPSYQLPSPPPWAPRDLASRLARADRRFHARGWYYTRANQTDLLLRSHTHGDDWITATYHRAATHL